MPVFCIAEEDVNTPVVPQTRKWAVPEESDRQYPQVVKPFGLVSQHPGIPFELLA